MGSRPEELRNEIEQTRGELAYDVDRLADRTVPSRVVERKWEGVKSKARQVSDRVMGVGDSATDTAAHAGDRVQELASRTGERIQDTAQDVAGTVRETPQAIARGARGNPVAAGLIAFGVGLLAASLMPETETETRAGAAVAERSEDLVDMAKEAGREMADDLSGPAREAVDSVGATAREAVQHTTEQLRESGRTTVDQTRSAVS